MTENIIKAKCLTKFLEMSIVDITLMASEMAAVECTMLPNKKFTMVIGQMIVGKARAW